MKILIDICNAAKIMLLGKGSSLAVGRGCGKVECPSRVSRDSSSTTLQAQPVWARGKAKQVPQCSLLLGKKKKKKKGQSPFQ